MSHPLRRSVAALVAAAALVAPAAANVTATAAPTRHDHGRHQRHEQDALPVLTGRATLPATYIAPGPPSGAKVDPNNGLKGPWPGQVIPGFSAMVDNGDGTFLAQPDNGFGSKGNSADFLLRSYVIKPNWETGRGRITRKTGTIEVQGFISYRDPNHKIAFPIVNGDTKERLLTGADFDVESMQRMSDGTLWVGEEFGPYLLHFSADGVLLDAPVPFIGGKAPANPELKPGEEATVASSRGFEALAASHNGRRLYAIVEGAMKNDTDKRRRWIYEFDTATKTYTGKRWAYRADFDSAQIGDAFIDDRGRIVLIERDDYEGPAAVAKKVYRVDMHHTDRYGNLRKSLAMDFLNIANPRHIGMTSDAGQYGVGDPFSYPIQSLEVLVPLKDGSWVSINDNNFPDSVSRSPGKVDDIEMIRLRVPGAR